MSLDLLAMRSCRATASVKCRSLAAKMSTQSRHRAIHRSNRARLATAYPSPNAKDAMALARTLEKVEEPGEWEVLGHKVQRRLYTVRVAWK